MPVAATCMQLQILMLSEVSQKDKDKIPYDITYMWNLKYGRDEPIYKTETDSQTKRTHLRLPKGGGEGVGWTGSLGVSGCKLLHLG